MTTADDDTLEAAGVLWQQRTPTEQEAIIRHVQQELRARRGDEQSQAVVAKQLWLKAFVKHWLDTPLIRDQAWTLVLIAFLVVEAFVLVLPWAFQLSFAPVQWVEAGSLMIGQLIGHFFLLLMIAAVACVLLCDLVALLWGWSVLASRRLLGHAERRPVLVTHHKPAFLERAFRLALRPLTWSYEDDHKPFVRAFHECLARRWAPWFTGLAAVLSLVLSGASWGLLRIQLDYRRTEYVYLGNEPPYPPLLPITKPSEEALKWAQGRQKEYQDRNPTPEPNADFAEEWRSYHFRSFGFTQVAPKVIYVLLMLASCLVLWGRRRCETESGQRDVIAQLITSPSPTPNNVPAGREVTTHAAVLYNVDRGYDRVVRSALRLQDDRTLLRVSDASDLSPDLPLVLQARDRHPSGAVADALRRAIQSAPRAVLIVPPSVKLPERQRTDWTFWRVGPHDANPQAAVRTPLEFVLLDALRINRALDALERGADLRDVRGLERGVREALIEGSAAPVQPGEMSETLGAMFRQLRDDYRKQATNHWNDLRAGQPWWRRWLLPDAEAVLSGVTSAWRHLPLVVGVLGMIGMGLGVLFTSLGLVGLGIGCLSSGALFLLASIVAAWVKNRATQGQIPGVLQEAAAKLQDLRAQQDGERIWREAFELVVHHSLCATEDLDSILALPTSSVGQRQAAVEHLRNSVREA